MAFIKALTLLAAVGYISAQTILAEVNSPAKYAFQYNVADPHTGDQKEQQEERDGDVVKGFYALVEPDGTYRRVDYTSDAEHGFQAVVRKEPGAAPPIQVQAVRTAVVAQPAVHLVSHAPVIRQQNVHVVSQPALHVAQPAVHVVSHAPVATRYVSTIPQYVTRTVANPGQYVVSYN